MGIVPNAMWNSTHRPPITVHETGRPLAPMIRRPLVIYFHMLLNRKKSLCLIFRASETGQRLRPVQARMLLENVTDNRFRKVLDSPGKWTNGRGIRSSVSYPTGTRQQ